jgi:hypothetical protein
LTTAGTRVRGYELTLVADPQPGAARMLIPSLEVSHDNGATWRRLSVGWSSSTQTGNAWLVEPRTPGFVSLRAKAIGADGSTVTQTVIRAYELV